MSKNIKTQPLSHDNTYHAMVLTALMGERSANRTGIDTVGVFGYMAKFDLEQGFPLISLKKTPFILAAHELMWILSGSTSTLDLNARGVRIWDPWATAEKCALFERKAGDLGPSYGHQWRKFNNNWDQLTELMCQIKSNPESRRLIVTLWNPGDVVRTNPPPCLCTYHFRVNNGRLDLCVYQRSLDLFLGAPFDLVGLGLLVTLIAFYSDLKPGVITWTIGDMHIYDNHIQMVKIMLNRSISPNNPTLKLNGLNKCAAPVPAIHELLKFDPLKNASILNYEPHPSIRGEPAI